jgi:hypothetical protein
MDLPKEFFTPQSATTLTGAVGITFVLTNTFRTAFGINPRWLALVFALAIALFGVWSTQGGPIDYVFGVLNGCLIYLSASGVSAVSKPGSGRRATRSFGDHAPAPALARQRFLDPWW